MRLTRVLEHGESKLVTNFLDCRQVARQSIKVNGEDCAGAIDRAKSSSLEIVAKGADAQVTSASIDIDKFWSCTDLNDRGGGSDEGHRHRYDTIAGPNSERH